MPPTAMAETGERSRVARVPAPRVPLAEPPEAAAPAVAPSAAPATAAAPAEKAEPEQKSRTRRLPSPPGRRAPLLLGALMAGAVLAAAPGLLGGAGPQPVNASDYGLGIADSALTGDLEDAGVRRGITEAQARARLDELAASRAAREPDVVSPMTHFTLTTCYCQRWGQMHYGLDMAAPLGTPIRSAIDGVVLEAGPASGFGNAVYIQDEDGNVHIYGHMRYYSVEAGDIVRAGEEIATVGNEGFSTGPHLHWEIHQGGRDGAPTDPQAWLARHDVHI